MENPALILYQLSKLTAHKVKHEPLPEPAVPCDSAEPDITEPCEEWPDVIGEE
jgi:hypothetical protein